MSDPKPKKQSMSVLEKHGFSGIKRWPTQEKIKADDGLDKFFFSGHVPKEPFITKQHSITAFGSCFAGNVSRFLAKRGYNINAHNWKHADSDFVRIDEIMVHTPALRMQLEWALEDKPLGQIFVGGAEEKGKTYHGEKEVQDIIANSDVFIITFGLSEAWYDNETETYLWKFIPRKKLDSSRFENRRVSITENIENITAIYDVIRRNRPDATIIFTLSPIPLLGTYGDKAILSANTVSKSKLRVAIDHVLELNSKDEKFYYFPSYELVLNYLDEPWEKDNRHLKIERTDEIMQMFEDKFVIV